MNRVPQRVESPDITENEDSIDRSATFDCEIGSEACGGGLDLPLANLFDRVAGKKCACISNICCACIKCYFINEVKMATYTGPLCPGRKENGHPCRCLINIDKLLHGCCQLCGKRSQDLHRYAQINCQKCT